uniref:Protein Ycf2 n=1 Tax=Enhalus acoroides TaxID=55455 RepID=A0A6M3QSI0_9LILI|nr:Ycf2 [Enhalus acoroides]QJC59129.1 Ycf2 [Enhalus acoroides]
MKTHPFQLWIYELRDVLRAIKKSHYFVDSWIKFQSIGSFIPICFHQERFLKLFDPLTVSILLSRDSRGSTSNLYLRIKKGVVLLIKVIKGGVLVVVVVLLSRISNRKMVESKNLYLMELLPIPRNSIGPRNQTLEESFWSSNINRLIVSLLHLPKGNPISENGFFVDPQESTWVLPRNQRNPKCIMPESNRGSRWWRKRVGKKRDSSCKISKETVAGIEISFKEKDSQCVEFLFLSYTDDPIRSWGKNWHESDFLRNVSRENWIWLDNVWLVNKDPFFSKVRNVSSNIQYDSARSIFAQVMHWGRWKRSSDPSRALFDSIRNEDSEYHKGIDQTEIQQRKEGSILFPVPEETEEFLGNPTRSIRSFFSDKWSELHLGSNPTEGSTRDQKFWKKKQDVSFVPFRRRSEEMVDLFKIIRYLQNTVSIHPISSDRGYDMVPQDETSIESSNKTSFWDQNRFLGFFHLFHDRNKGGYTLGHDLESEERFTEMADRFTLSITEPDLVYPRGLAFSRDSYGLDPNQFLNGVFHSRDESKKKSLLVLPPLLISRTERSMNRDPDAYRYKGSNRSNNFQEHLEHFVSEQKTRFQGVFDRFQGGFDRFQGGFGRFQGVFDRFQRGFDLEGVFDRFQRGFDLEGVFDRFQRGFDLEGVFDRFQRGFDLEGRFVRFQGVLDRLRKKINPDSMDWFELIDIDIEELSREIRFAFSLHFFVKEAFPFFVKEAFPFFVKEAFPFFLSKLSKSLLFLPNVHWKMNKRKPFLFLLDDHDTSQRPKFLIYGGIRFPSGFHKIPKWMMDSFHTRNHRRKSFENTDSYFSMISHDRDNWLNPVKPFHRSSLISSFYKANRLRFLNHPRHFWFHCNKGFPFDVEKTHIHTEDLTYGQFLNISFIRNKIFSLCVGKKKEICLERETISPIELQVSDIFLSKDFPQSGDGTYNLYKSFHFPIRFDPFVRAIYSIADISETPLTEEQMAHLERTDCQPFSDRNLLSDSEGKNLHQYLHFHSNMGFIHTPCPEKSFLPSGNRKKRSLCRKKCVEKWQMYRNRKGESAFSHFSKSKGWNLFQTYMPWFLTSTGCKYLHFTLLDTFSNSLPILSSRLVSIVNGVIYRWGISWPISENEWRAILLKKQRNRIRDISSSCLFPFLSEEMIHRNHELPWIWTRLISKKALESFYLSIFFFLLVAGYWVGIHLFFVSQTSREFKTKLEKIQSLVIPSYIMELQTLRDQYPPSQPLSFWFKNLFFSRNTRHLSRTSKEIYSLIRERKSVNDGNWMDDQIEFWLGNNHFIQYEEKPFLIQFSNLTTETRMDSILWSLTHSDHFSLSKNDSGYPMNEQPGSIYLRYIVDIHNKSLMNYEFHRSCLAERRIFLAHYQTITYSQTSCGANRFHFPSHGKPFSLRLDLSPSKRILVIGSRGTGRSYLVKYLAANSYVPFITVCLTEYLPNKKFPSVDWTYYAFKPQNLYLINDDDLDTELLAMTDSITNIAEWQQQAKNIWRQSKLKRLVISMHLELAKTMSPCIIWIPNIHDLYVRESDYVYRGLLVNYLSRDSERCSTRNFLVIASTHIPKKVDPILIAPNKFNTCIKIRKLLLSQQQKHFFILSYTRGFHFEKNLFHIQKLGSVIMGSNARDLAALVNEALSISITQKKSILETNTMRSALHRQTWEMQAPIRFFHDPGILFYKIGKVFAQNVLLRNESLYPISIYGKEPLCLYKWCLEFGRSMKKFTIFLYFLSCSAGSVARDLWSPLGPDERDWITFSSSHAFLKSHGFVESDSDLVHSLLDLVHGLLEVEDALVGSSRTEKDCSQFDNNRVPWLLRSEPRNPLNMMQNTYCSILDRLEDEDGKGTFDLQQIEGHFFNHIVCWAPRIWRPYLNQVNWIERPRFSDLDRFFREGRTMQYPRRERCSKEEEEGFFVFGRKRCVWDPVDPFFSLFLQDQPLASAFSRRGKLFDKETLKELMTDCDIEMIDNDETEMIHDDDLDETTQSWSTWVKKNMQKMEMMAYERKNKNLFQPYLDKNTPDWIPDQRRWFRAYSSLSLYNHGSFRSKMISESYQYLSNLFLSNGTLLDQMTKTLLRKRWLFPLEMQHLIQDWIQER